MSVVDRSFRTELTLLGEDLGSHRMLLRRYKDIIVIDESGWLSRLPLFNHIGRIFRRRSCENRWLVWYVGDYDQLNSKFPDTALFKMWFKGEVIRLIVMNRQCIIVYNTNSKHFEQDTYLGYIEDICIANDIQLLHMPCNVSGYISLMTRKELSRPFEYIDQCVTLRPNSVFERYLKKRQGTYNIHS